MNLNSQLLKDFFSSQELEGKCETIWFCLHSNMFVTNNVEMDYNSTNKMHSSNYFFQPNTSSISSTTTTSLIFHQLVSTDNESEVEDNTSQVLDYLNITTEMPITYAVPLYGYFLPFLLVITIVANTLIVVVLSKRHMRTPTNMVLMAMALCDLFTLLVPAPWLIYMYTFGNHYKPLWPVSLCFAWNAMHEVSLCVLR